MAKLIKLTPEIIEEVKKEFDVYVKDKISDGRISFQKTINTVQRKATVYFVESAYRKFQALVKDFDKEVGWHGIAYRSKDENKDDYYITDILVYPQEVTGDSITPDQNKYQTWLMNHDDETFNNIRMQGHSHVNMGVTPSPVDNALYEKIVSQLDDTMFYIFMIWNKKGDRTCKVYDMRKNIFFDTADCEIKIITEPPADVKIDGVTNEEQSAMLDTLKDLRYEKMCKQFVDEAKKLVTTKAYTTVFSRTGTSGSYGNYGGYGGYYNGYYGTSSTTSSLATTPSKKDDDSGKKGKRKGKRKDSSKTSQNFYYDDEDDLYGYNGGLWT